MHLTLIILQSLNGFIAKKQNDDLSWGSSEDKGFFRTKTKEIGTMIMGSSTYDNMPSFAFKDRYSLVMTSDTNRKLKAENIDFFEGSPKQAVEFLESKNIQKAALIGGGKVNGSFLKTGLVNEIFITIAPKIFNPGIPGFGLENLDIDLDLLETKKISNNEILLHYRVKG